MDLNTVRSILFVPASRPERIPKALGSAADAVIVDLEDAVAEEDKASARKLLGRFLTENPAENVLVRVNAPGTPDFSQDLALCAQHRCVSAIMIPKAQTCQALEQAARCNKPVWPLIETARGLLALPELIRVAGVERLSFGALDMSAELGLTPATRGAEKVLDQCRYQLLVNSRAAGLAAPVESVHPQIEDTEAVAQAANQAREMGFGGMLCIHPRQLDAVNRAFTPRESEIEWARRIVQGASQEQGAFRIDGQMVDAPVIARAKSILSRLADH